MPFDARAVEGDLEGALLDGGGLTDELVQPIVIEQPATIDVDVEAIRGTGRFAAEPYPEGN